MSGAPLSPLPPQAQAALSRLLNRRSALATAPLLAYPEQLSSGLRGLDQQLPGGGWPKACTTELLTSGFGRAEIGLIAPALQQLAASGRLIHLLGPASLAQSAAWSALGSATAHLRVTLADRPTDRLYKLERAVLAPDFGALVIWLDAQVSPELLRRVALLAQKAQGPVFVFRPLQAQGLASPAPLRLALLPRDYPSLGIQLLKRGGPVSNQTPVVPSTVAGQPRSAAQPTHPRKPLGPVLAVQLFEPHRAAA